MKVVAAVLGSPSLIIIFLLFQAKSENHFFFFFFFLKNASLLVCETPFLHSLTIEWMCGCRGGGVNMITDVLYSLNMYILFRVKRFELSHCMDTAL